MSNTLTQDQILLNYENRSVEIIKEMVAIVKAAKMKAEKNRYNQLITKLQQFST